MLGIKSFVVSTQHSWAAEGSQLPSDDISAGTQLGASPCPPEQGAPRQGQPPAPGVPNGSDCTELPGQTENLGE